MRTTTMIVTSIVIVALAIGYWRSQDAPTKETRPIEQEETKQENAEQEAPTPAPDEELLVIDCEPFDPACEEDIQKLAKLSGTSPKCIREELYLFDAQQAQKKTNPNVPLDVTDYVSAECLGERP